jgi:hypothetical protein
MPYLAYYESADLVEAAAKAAGFTGNDGESWHDFIEAENSQYRVSREFADLEYAMIWLRHRIAHSETVYGCGTIVEYESLLWSERCLACTCHGERAIHEYTVDDDGISDEFVPDSPCTVDD